MDVKTDVNQNPACIAMLAYRDIQTSKSCRLRWLRNEQGFGVLVVIRDPVRAILADKSAVGL